MVAMERRKLAVEGIEGRLFEPAGASGAPLLVWAGSERLAGDLAQRSGWAVAAVDYRFGADELFPAALSDVYRCLAHFAATGRPAVAVGGSDFGGGLAAAAALLARRYGDPPPAAQVLLAPLLDMRLASPSWDRYAGPAERQQLDAAIAAHAPGLDRSDPLLSPLCAEDFSGLPDAVIVTAGADPRRDDGERYAQLLTEAGVVVWGHRYPGAPARPTPARAPARRRAQSWSAAWPAPWGWCCPRRPSAAVAKVRRSQRMLRDPPEPSLSESQTEGDNTRRRVSWQPTPRPRSRP